MSAPTGRPIAQGDVLWSPPSDARERFVIGRYLGWLERERGLSFAGYDELWRWSVSDLEGFWSSVWEFFEVRSHAPYERVLGSREMPGAEWFPGARLNFAEHMVGRDEDLDASAVVAYSQTRADARADVRRPPRAGRPRPRRPAAAGRRPRRPGSRLPPEHPGDARRLPREREPRRDLGDVPTRVRRAQRARPPRAARAEGHPGRRRLPVRRQARRPARAGRGDTQQASERRDRRARPVRRRGRRRASRRGLLGRPPRRAGRARVRPAARSTTRSTCSSRPARPGCRRRSCTATAASCSSI